MLKPREKKTHWKHPGDPQQLNLHDPPHPVELCSSGFQYRRSVRTCPWKWVVNWEETPGREKEAAPLPGGEGRGSEMVEEQECHFGRRRERRSY